MPRLPQPGSDDGVWGDILNDYLSRSLTSDGKLRAGAVEASSISVGSVHTEALADSSVTSVKLAAESPSTGAVLTYDSSVPGNLKWQNVSGGGATNLTVTQSSSSVTIGSDTGTDATIQAVDATNAGMMTPVMKTKLDGIATGATVNSTDATLLDRTNHTGVQQISTISGLQTAIDAKAPTVSPTLTGTITHAGQTVIPKTDSDSSSRIRYDYTGSLATTNPNASEFYVNGSMKSWHNEWGALRGTSPYSWGDSLVRGVRSSGDGIGGGNFVEISDRRSSPTVVSYGRQWASGNLVRNGIVMSDCYLCGPGLTKDTDPNVALLPSGTLIFERV